MRRLLSLTLVACIPAVARAQLPQQQIEPEIRVEHPAALALTIHNFRYNYPLPYQPPDSTQSPMLGSSVFYRAEPDGDTTSLGVSLADAGAAAELALTYTADGSIRACEPVVNDLTGRIALIERGPSAQTDPCYFNVKVRHAEEAGAIGAIIFNDPGRPGDVIFGGMSAGDPSFAVGIPALLIPRGMTVPWLDAVAGGHRVCVRMSGLCSDAGCGGPITYGVCTATASEPGPTVGARLVVSPNPARGRVAVVITLGEATRVRMGVYDVLGREAALLHDGALPAGRHDLPFDAGSLAPGVYVVRVAGEAFTATRAVTVVR